MDDKPSTIPSPGENPGLDEEAIKTLRSRRSTLPAGDAQEVGEIRDLTEQLLEKNLEGVEIHETDEPIPNSMVPERLKITNRPPNTGDYNDILKALKRPTEKEPDPPTVYCVEQEKE